MGQRENDGGLTESSSNLQVSVLAIVLYIHSLPESPSFFCSARNPNIVDS